MPPTIPAPATAPPAWRRMGRRVWRRVWRREWRRVWVVALLGLAAAALVTGARVGLPAEVDPSAPFVVGSRWGLAEALAARGVPVTPEAVDGYDGQWFLGLAYDPLAQSEIVASFDRPQYRAMRPLLPAAGWLLAAGQPGLIPYGLLVANILAVGLGCAAAARIAVRHGRSAWWGLLFAAIPGVVVGVQYGTAEPLGVAMAALGLALLVDRRPAWAGVAFAGAALAKETYLGFAAMAAVFLAVQARFPVQARFRGREWLGHAALVAAPGVVALAAWWGYVSAVVPASPRTPNHLLDPPLLGWLPVFGQIARGEYPVYPWLGPVLLVGSFGLLVAALATAVAMAVWRRWSLLGCQVLLWSPFALSLVQILLLRFLSAQRVLAPMLLAAGLLLVTAPVSREFRGLRFPGLGWLGRRPGTVRIDPAAPPAAPPARAATPATGPD